MKVCYCDESGTGDEPIAIMAGIVVDSQRMHVTKEHWSGLLATLSEIVGSEIRELHTRDFYPGNGVWRGLDGPKREKVITSILEWLADRKHHIVYSAVVKDTYFESKNNDKIPQELNTLWRFMGYHIILAVQRCYQKESKTKGNTLFIFDNEEREEKRFIDIINNPPPWSDSYYDRQPRRPQLCQIVDVPYFGDSRDVPLIQLADFVAFFLRRYAEIKEDLIGPKYPAESTKITGWAKLISSRSIGKNHIYTKTKRCDCAELFYSHAPRSIREL